MTEHSFADNDEVIRLVNALGGLVRNEVARQLAPVLASVREANNELRRRAAEQRESEDKLERHNQWVVTQLEEILRQLGSDPAAERLDPEYRN